MLISVNAPTGPSVPPEAIEMREHICFQRGSTQPFTGSVVTNWENGQIHMLTTYVKGQLTLIQWWFPNGQQEFEGNYHQGRPHGYVQEWYDNGQLEYKALFMNGAEEDREEWEQDGTPREVVTDKPKEEPDVPVGSPYKPVSFSAGERTDYLITLRGVEVGHGTFSVRKRDLPVSPWQFDVHLSAFKESVIYDVSSTVDSSFSHSLEYRAEKRGRVKSLEELLFDPMEQTVLCKLDGKISGRPMPMPVRIFDPLSMIFALREMDYNNDPPEKWAITDGRAHFNMIVDVSQPKVTAFGGLEARAFLVEPNLRRLESVFSQGLDSILRIWFSADRKRRLLKLRFPIPGLGDVEAITTS